MVSFYCHGAIIYWRILEATVIALLFVRNKMVILNQQKNYCVQVLQGVNYYVLNILFQF